MGLRINLGTFPEGFILYCSYSFFLRMLTNVFARNLLAALSAQVVPSMVRKSGRSGSFFLGGFFEQISV